MATLDPAAPLLDGEPRVVPMARVRDALRNFVRSIRSRREIERLGAMSDAELADIGLRRADLHVALRSPFGVDSTASLRAMASTRDTLCDEDAARRVC